MYCVRIVPMRHDVFLYNMSKLVVFFSPQVNHCIIVYTNLLVSQEQQSEVNPSTIFVFLKYLILLYLLYGLFFFFFTIKSLHKYVAGVKFLR